MRDLQKRDDIALKASGMADREIRRRLLDAIGTNPGVHDVTSLVVATGLAPGDVERVLRGVVADYDCVVRVGDDGSMAFDFGGALVLRDEDQLSRAAKIKRWLWKAFKVAFKASIAVVLVGYTVFFVLLIIALIVARASADDDSDVSFGGGRGGGGGLWWMWGWGGGGRRYDDRALDPNRDTRPFYKKVFSFVFGEEEEASGELDAERELLLWIQARGGVVSLSEMVEFTGWSVDRAEHVSTRFMATYDGRVDISPDGTVVYSFEGIGDLAEERGSGGMQPQGFVSGWEQPRTVTANKPGTNVGIVAMNTFVFICSLAFATSPLMQQWPPVAGFAAFVFPLIYSTTFFAVPLVRRFTEVRGENNERQMRNVRRGVVRHVFAYSQGTAEPIYPDDARRLIASKLADGALLPKDLDAAIDAALQDMAVEFDAEHEIDEDGRDYFLFHRVAKETAAAANVRSGEADYTTKSAFEAELAEFEARLKESAPRHSGSARSQRGSASAKEGADESAHEVSEAADVPGRLDEF